MQEKGNSGILQVKQCPVSKMTDPLQLLSANAQCIASLSREVPPRAGGQVWEGSTARGLGRHLESHTFSG